METKVDELSGSTSVYPALKRAGDEPIKPQDCLQYNTATLPTDLVEFRCYDQSAIDYHILFTVNTSGRIIRDGVDITDNDSAVAECLIDYLNSMQGVQVNRGS